jgi:peroxiredoxin
MTVDATVADSPAKVCPLLVGVAIPQVTLQTVDGEPFDLNRAVSERPSVLVFYRGGW